MFASVFFKADWDKSEYMLTWKRSKEWKSNINIWYNSRRIIIAWRVSEKSYSIMIIQNFYQFFSFSVQRTKGKVNERLWLSRPQKVNLVFSYFLTLIFILFWFILIFPFLELRVRTSDNITQSHNAWKDVEGSRRSDII